MLQLIDDETASRYYNEIDTATGDDLQTKMSALESWATAKKAEQHRQEWDNVSKVFTDFDNYVATEGLDEFDEESRYEFANRKFIAHQTGDTPDNQMFVYPSKRDEVTDQLFGKVGVSEKEAFNLFKGAVEARKASEEALRELPGVLAQGILKSAGEGKPFDEVDSWFAFDGWKQRHADKLGAMPAGWETAMLDSAVKLHARTESLMADMSPESKRAMDVLMKFTRPEDAESLPDADRADVENLAKDFAKLTPEQRDGIYATLSYAAEAGGAGLGKGFWEKVGEGIARGGVNIYDDAAMTAEDRETRKNISFFQDLLDKPQAEPDRMQTAESIKLQRDEVQKRLDANQQRLNELRVMREIRDLAQGRIDPIKTEMDGVLGQVVQGAYDFSQSAAYTGMAMIPYVGLPAVMGALANSNYLRMLDEYPDMDADAAYNLSLAIAGPQAVIERFQGGLLLGKLPYLNQAMKRLTDVRVPLPARLGLGYAGVVGAETVTELAQEAMPVVADQIAAAVREDMPEFDSEKAWGEYREQAPGIFYSMLWGGLIGGGAVGIRELDRSGVFLRNVQELEMHGITGEAAQNIAAEQDPDAATTLFREAWDKRTPEDIQAGISKRAAMLDAAQATQANPDLPTRRVEQAPDGTTTHIIEQNGQTIYRTSDPAAADMALINITRMMDRSRITGTTTGIVESLQFIDQVNQATNRGEDVQKLLLDGAPRTLLDDYEANPTEQNLDNLFATVRAFGQDIREPAELANFPVLASNQGALAEGIFKSVIRIQDGATGVEVMRDFSQDNLKRAIGEGRVTMDWVREQLNQVIPLIESDRLEGRSLRTETDTDVIESFSDVAVAYMNGRIRDEQIPAGFRGFLRRMAIVVKDIFRRAYRLKRAIAEGKVDANFETFLAESVGLNQQTLTDTVRDRAKTDLVTDGGQMLMDFSIGSRASAVSNDTPALRAGNATIVSPTNFSIGAYHGTPHKVDKFSTEKIGAGEGVQAYGWGLYFAENEKVAAEYRDALAYKSRRKLYDGGEFNADNPSHVAAFLGEEGVKEFVETGFVDWADTEGISKDQAQKALDWIKSGRQVAKYELTPPSSNLYTVDLDVEPEDLLDWDKPLSQQSEKIRSGLSSAFGASQNALEYWTSRLVDDLAENGPSGYSENRLNRVINEAVESGGYGEEFGFQVWDEIKEAAPEVAEEFIDWVKKHSAGGIAATDTGESLYRLLASTKGSPKAASEALFAAGIPGIRYLDGGSRSEGQGTYNYVIFDENLIKITGENGQPVTMQDAQPVSTDTNAINYSIGSDMVVENGRAYSPMVRDLLQRRAAGEDIPRSVIDQAINDNFPAQLVEPPKSESDLPTRATIDDAINEGQRRDQIDKSSIQPGDAVTIRQDVPAMTRKGVGVVTIKGKSGNSYDAAARISDPQFILNEKKSLEIGMGGAKGPHIAIRGKWASDQSMPSDLNQWTQVGFNPDRHSFYYDRATMKQVVGGSEAYQIGNTVFVKDAKFGDGQISDISYSIGNFLNQVRTQSRGKKPISIEIGKLDGVVLQNLPDGFQEVSGLPIKIDEDLIRKNDNLSKEKKTLLDLRIQIPSDEDYSSLSDFINSADRVSVGQIRKDGTRTLEFRNSEVPKVAATAVRTKAGYLAVVRFVGEEVALPLTEPNEGRLELTSETASQNQSATLDGKVNYSIGLSRNSISQVSDKDDQFRVGTAKLGTSKVPKDTPQDSNVSGDNVPDDLLAKQMEKMNYAHLPKNIFSEKDPKKKRRKLINWFKKNLLALHDAFPEEFRARATHWYDGANRIAKEMGGQFQASVEQASGVIAVFSPQKDWFMNVAQAEQFMELWTNSKDVVLEESLVRAEIEGIIEAATAPDKQKRKKVPGETKEQTAERREYNKALDDRAKSDRRKKVEQVIGKTIRQLDSEPDLQGWAIRVLAQVTFGRNYRNLSPEGDRLGMATNDDGALAKNGWGSINEIEKAVRIMKDGSLKNISDNLGNEHKVRNFYNNIVAPNTPYGDATIDTHAVAAAHLMPYGAKAIEVGHNFGSGMNGSEVLGISGVYHLYLDAYREAAADRGILPRQMQSITWEAIRLVYPAANKNAAALAKSQETWKSFKDDIARNTLVGGRIPSPVWAGTNDNRESQGNPAGVGENIGQEGVSGGSLLSGVRPTGAGRDGGVNFSIASQSEIDRVNRALGGMNRGPDARIAVYERAKAKFSTLLQNNQQALDNLRAGTVSFRRTQLLQALGELDAILSIFPPDIRGRVGGYTRLASIAPHDVYKDGEKVSEVSGMNGAIISAWMREGLSIGPAGQQTELPPGYTAKENLGTARADRAIADFFKKRIEMIDRELEKTLRREYDEAFRKLLDRTKPKKAKPGEKPKGIGGDIQDLFAVVRNSVDMNATQVAAHIAGLDSMIASGELTAEQEARAQVEAALVALTGDWKNADADRRRTAFMEASRIWNGAYATHAQKIIRQREEREIARAEAIIATGKAGELAGRKSKAIADSGLKGSWKDYILNLLNFDQVVGVLFGENTEVANTIIDKQRRAENAKEDGSQAKMQELEDFFTGLAGGNVLDGERLRYRLTQPSMTVKGIEMSELEALSAVMMWVQEDGRRHMEGEMDEAGRPVGKWHYNQDFVDEILANLSEEALALRSWLTRNYANEYAKINEVYSELNGVNLPQIQLYSPVTVQPVNAPTGQVLDPVSGSAMSGASTSPGALRTRGTAIAEPRFQDVLQTYISHTLQMEHWKAFAPMIAEANGILRNRDVQNSVEEKGGVEARKMLNAWLDYFAQGGTRDAGAHLALNQGLNNVLGRASQVALVGRASTLLIQSTQLGAALAEMPVKAYLKRMGKLLTGQLGWDSALNSDYIQRRVKQMPPVVQLAMQGLKGARPTAIQQAGKRLGMLLSGADGLFTAGTYAITYDYHLTKAKELGLAGQEAEDYARNTAERVTDRIAQPTRAGARSLYENTSTNPLARAGWAFASEARKNLALVAYSFAERDTATKMRTLAYVVALNAIGSAILRSIWRDILDDEDDELFDDKYWSPKRIATAIATEPLYGFPVLGSVVQEAVYKSFGEYKPSESLFSVQNAIGPIKRLPDHLSGDTDLREVMRDIDMVVSALGIMHPNIAAAASITHLAKDLFNLTDSTVDAVTEN